MVETLGGASHPDTLLARQMQALSLAAHIPIVCFGIAFPATRRSRACSAS
jgi:cytochrome bd ubiquinol oxidase subunit I